MTCNRGDFFVGEVAVDREIDHQTSPKRVERIFGRMTKGREIRDERVEEIPPVLGKGPCRDLLPVLVSEKVLSSRVPDSEKFFVPVHWAVVRGT